MTVSVDAPVGRRPAGMVELPLSPQQKRWWLLATKYPGTSSPVALAALRLRGPLDVGAWTRAVAAVVDRHEILRARFVDREPEPVQVIDPPHGFDVEVVDLRGEPDAEQRARRLLDERWESVLDLERGPLMAACLLRLADDDHVWFIKVHHILVDGASIGIISRELSALYTGQTLPEPSLGYGDYTVWYDRVRPAHDDDLEYWIERLDGVPPLDLPTDRPRPAVKAAPAADVAARLDSDAAQAIDRLAAEAGCTRFVVLLAAFQALLGRRADQTDFSVGVPVAGYGRTRAEVAGVVGLFNNTVALRCDLGGDPAFRDLLADTADHVIDALDFQGVPFSRVMAELKVPHDPGRAQVFQTLFMYDENGATGGLHLPGVHVEEFALTMPRILHDLMVFAHPDGDGFTLRIAYDTALFDPSTMEALLDDYVRLLRTAAGSPDLRLSELAAA